MDERRTIRTLEAWMAYEGRAWHSAWADRGLSFSHMSPEEAAAVRNLDHAYGVILDEATSAEAA